MGSVEWLAICDLRAIQDRDLSTKGLLTPFLHIQGYKAIQAHRLAHVFLRNGMTQFAYLIQQRTFELWGVDINPAAVIGGGFMLNHATGIVIGETARIGYGCTMKHNTTLGSTGKEHGDRHPKLGNNITVGLGATILGNIRIGDNTKIGAMAVVLKDMPGDCTVVGNPGRIVRIRSSKALAPKFVKSNNQNNGQLDMATKRLMFIAHNLCDYQMVTDDEQF